MLSLFFESSFNFSVVKPLLTHSPATTTTTTTTTTTSTTTTTTTTITSTSTTSTTTMNNFCYKNNNNIDYDVIKSCCPPIKIKGFDWPAVHAGSTAHIPCPNNPSCKFIIWNNKYNNNNNYNNNIDGNIKNKNNSVE